MSALAKTAYFWRSAAHGMRHAPFVHVIAVTTIALALFATGAARTAVRFVDGLIATMGGEVEMTVYLAPEATPEEVRKLSAALESRTGGRARFVAPDEAMRRLAGQLGDLGSTLEGLPDNPLPASLEVTLPPSARDPAALKDLAEKTRQLEMVEGVDYGAEAVERLTGVARGLKWASLVGFAIAVLTTIVVVSATLQLAIYARREEIEIQKLVGATDRFVRAPFLIEGLFQGLVGAAIALGALYAFRAFAGPMVAETFSFLKLSRMPDVFDARQVIELVAVGCALGLGGSMVAVRRFLRV